MQKRASKYRIYRGIYASRKSVAICTASMPVALRLLKLTERCIYTFSALENDKNTLNLCMQRYTQSHMYNMIDRLTSIQTKIYTHAESDMHGQDRTARIGNAGSNANGHPQRARASTHTATHANIRPVNANGLITKFERVNQVNINDYNVTYGWQQ